MLLRAVLLRNDNCVYNLPLDRCLPLKSAPDELGREDEVPSSKGLVVCPWPCPPVLRADLSWSTRCEVLDVSCPRQIREVLLSMFS